MRRAINNLIRRHKIQIAAGKLFCLIDGNQPLDVKYPQMPIIGGDRTVFSISAASIVAKVLRDRLMVRLDKIYPGYGFVRHKGYGTAIHRQALARLGPCPIHRRSFAPVSVLMNDFPAGVRK